MKKLNYIFLYRDLKENPIYTNSKAVHCWVECLLRASYKKREVYLKREKVFLKPGQFVMGRDEFGTSVNMSGSTAWYWILQFEADNMVDIKKTAKGSVVSIKNWNKYQRVDSTLNNKKTAKKQQINTNNKVKKVNKVNNIYNSIKNLGENEFEEIAMSYKVPVSLVRSSYDDLVNYCQSKGKSYKNYMAALRNFVKGNAMKTIKEATNDKFRPVNATNL